MSVYLKLLGSPTIYHNSNKLEFKTTRKHVLLFYLAINGDWVSREVLADLLWDSDDARVRDNFRVTLSKTRSDNKFSWAHTLETKGSLLKLPLDNDVSEFRKAINEKQWIKALELYQGPFLKDVSIRNAPPQFWEWLDSEREDISDKWRTAVMTQAKIWEREERFTDASDLVQILLEDVTAYDVIEEALLQLFSCANKSGEYDQALRCYQNTKRRLASEEMLLSKGVEELAGQLEQRRQQQTLVVEVPPTKHTIPEQANTFIGRDMELKEIATQLEQDSCRLLTLKGLGGIGKTRLALQVALGQKENFNDGVHFIPLAPLQSTNNLAATILNTLKISLLAGQTPEFSLKENLKSKEMLLVLDNFEHLLAGTPLLNELLGHALNLKLLVTSREPLNITWEHTFEVYGMRYPKKSNDKEFAQYDAVRLFTRTAQQGDSQFKLEAEHYPTVLEICRIVDGMPLGLELAAGWLQLLSYRAT